MEPEIQWIYKNEIALILQLNIYYHKSVSNCIKNSESVS